MYERASGRDCTSRELLLKNAQPLVMFTLVVTANNEVEDDSTPLRPFYLCTALLRNWRWACVHPCVRIEMGVQRVRIDEAEYTKHNAVCLVVVASIWVMHIFMGGCLGSGRQKAMHPLI